MNAKALAKLVQYWRETDEEETDAKKFGKLIASVDEDIFADVSDDIKKLGKLDDGKKIAKLSDKIYTSVIEAVSTSEEEEAEEEEEEKPKKKPKRKVEEEEEE